MPKPKAAPLDSTIVMPEKGKAKSVAAKEPQGEVIALTVRLDPDRYVRLKTHGAKTRRTNQEIMVQALDEYLKAVGA